MFGSALSHDDARNQLAHAIARNAMGTGSESEIKAVASKKWKCGECGKKAVIDQCFKPEEGGFSLVCPHCGQQYLQLIVVPKRS